MAWLALVLTLFAAPFWETKSPADWNDQELLMMLTDSPWAQLAQPAGAGPAPVVQVYLATAAPIDAAEHERDARIKRNRPPNAPPIAEDPLFEDYKSWLADNRGSSIVLAIRMEADRAFSNAEETRHMEEECVMRVGRKKYKIIGHFPPSANDPYLRLAFPRQVDPREKKLNFDLYLPGVAIPFRQVEFQLKDMVLRGKLEL